MSNSRNIADSAPVINFIDGVTSNIQTQLNAKATSPVNLASAVTSTLPVANGGTGAATLTANNVLLGNGTSAPLAVAPSTSGNVLTSNGTTWQSTAPAGGGAWELLATYTPSSASTVNVEAFSSTYDDYVIIGTLTSVSAIPRIRIKLGSGSYGTGGYSWNQLDYNSFNNNGASTEIQMGGDIGSGSSGASIKMSFITNCFNVNDSTYHGVFGTTNNATSYYMRGIAYSGYYYSY